VVPGVRLRLDRKVKTKGKIKVKGDGRECPFHTASAAEAGFFLLGACGTAEAVPCYESLLFMGFLR
jgi:hypothetical protein